MSDQDETIPWESLPLSAMSDEALVRYAIKRGALWCGNCDGRKCMACVLREIHDECDDDCPDCCLTPADGWIVTKVQLGSVLRQGWARSAEVPA